MIAFLIASLAGMSGPDASSPKDLRVALQMYARCLVQTKGYQIRPLLSEPVGPGSDAKWRALADGDCLATYLDASSTYEGSLAFQTLVLRGTVYEALFHKDFRGVSQSRPLSDVSPVHYPISSDTANSQAAAYVVEMEIGDCVVRRDFRDARTLIDAPIGTDEESQIIQAMIPTLSACTPKDQTLSFSKSSFRGMIAEVLYRFTAAQKALAHA